MLLCYGGLKIPDKRARHHGARTRVRVKIATGAADIAGGGCFLSFLGSEEEEDACAMMLAAALSPFESVFFVIWYSPL